MIRVIQCKVTLFDISNRIQSQFPDLPASGNDASFEGSRLSTRSLWKERDSSLLSMQSRCWLLLLGGLPESCMARTQGSLRNNKSPGTFGTGQQTRIPISFGSSLFDSVKEQI